MPEKSLKMSKKKRIVLIAHDNRKGDLVDWARFNKGTLIKHELYATGTTGKILKEYLGLNIFIMQSGPLGGDLQIGSKISLGEIDCMIFFWDPLEAQPHDVDVRALLRIGVVYNIPVACNRSTADFLISSPLFSTEYNKMLIDYKTRMKVELP